jgi:small subunit ribosomal protein S20
MASSISSKKRIRQNAKRRARNRWRSRTMREAVKEFLDKIAHGSATDAATAFQAASKIIDRTAQRGVIHRNQAARRKSRLSAKLRAKKSGAVPATA